MSGSAQTYVTDWLAKRAQLTPDRVAYVDRDTGRETTYAEWNGRANRTANYLRRLGVGIRDRVSVYSSNRSEYVDLFFACGKIGAVIHNLNWRLTVNELRGILAEADPTLFVYSPEWREQVNELRPVLPESARVVAMAELADPDDLPLTGRDAESDDLTSRPDLAMADPWGIYFTGGTTGLPKGAILTHGNMTWNSVNTVVSWGLTSDDSAALQLPFFHIGGPNIFLLPLVHVGGRSIQCTGFDVEETFDLVDERAVTMLVGVPTMYTMIQQHPRWDATDFSHLKIVISGGAPCPLPVMERFWEKGVDFKTGYGLSEASGNNFWLPPADVRRKAGAVGYPLFHIDARTVDEDGSPTAPGEPGELVLRGPHVFAGYWKHPEETAEALRDGWLHTGDVAIRDDEGCFRILGRSKEMLISGGENVYPAEVESVMHAHPAVAEAALLGVPDDKWGEVGRAYVVVEHGRSLSTEDLLDFLGERLARYKLPRSVVFLDELPKTVVGKIDKTQLAARAPDAGR